ncbi:hypothetical protein AYI70_g1630 [Smittium culicis]|uniref:Uncharacterized protein n=1 Tax=Smittium culicis TaxID=133412 RepID=A0A1R1YBW0_9FUNG|nr:hypothetical protein AYI70_g1630 [Smittium culicis]
MNNKYFNIPGHSKEITAIFEWVDTTKNITTLKKNNSAINHELLDLVPENSYLITASKDFTINIFNLKNQIFLTSIQLLSSPIVDFLVSPDAFLKHEFKNCTHSNILNKLDSLIICIALDNSVAVISLITLSAELVLPPMKSEISSVVYYFESNKLTFTYSDFTKKSVSLDFMNMTGYISNGICKNTYEWNLLSSNQNNKYPKKDSWINIRSGTSSRFNRSVVSTNKYMFNDEVTLDVLKIESLYQNNQISKIDLEISKYGLSVLLGWDLMPSIDSEIVKFLQISKKSFLNYSSFSIQSFGMISACLPMFSNSKISWEHSGTINAQRLLLILVYSRFLFEENEKLAVNLVNFYLGLLPNVVGKSYQFPDIYYLASFFLNPNQSLQNASRMLLYSTVKKLGKKRKAEICEECSIKTINQASSILHSKKILSDDISETLVVISTIASHSPHLISLNVKSALASILTTLVDFDHNATNIHLIELTIELLIIRNFEMLKSYFDVSKTIENLLFMIFFAMNKKTITREISTFKDQNESGGTRSATIVGSGKFSESQTFIDNNSSSTNHGDTIVQNHDKFDGNSSILDIPSTPTMSTLSDSNTSKLAGSDVSSFNSPRTDSLRLKNQKESFEGGDLNYTQKPNLIGLFKSAIIHILVVDSNSNISDVYSIASILTSSIPSSPANSPYQNLATDNTTLHAKNRYFAIGNPDGTVDIFNTISNKCSAKIKHSSNELFALALNADTHLAIFSKLAQPKDNQNEDLSNTQINSPDINSLSDNDGSGLLSIYKLRSNTNLMNQLGISKYLFNPQNEHSPDLNEPSSANPNIKTNLDVSSSQFIDDKSKARLIKKPTKFMRIPSHFLEPLGKNQIFLLLNNYLLKI